MIILRNVPPILWIQSLSTGSKIMIMTETEFCESVMNDFAVSEEKAAAIYSAFVT